MNNPFLTQTPQAVKYLSKAVSCFNSKLNVFLYAAIRHANFPNVSETTINWNEFGSFKLALDNEILKEYIEVYWQLEDVTKSVSSDSKNTINEIYKCILGLKIIEKANIEREMKSYIKNMFPIIFPIKEFEILLSEDQCHYCKITLDQIKKLVNLRQIFKKQITRGWSMEIDRKEPNLEYFKDNCVPCCYWCNNAKTDEFNELEFLKIALGIRQIWEDRLSKS